MIFHILSEYEGRCFTTCLFYVTAAKLIHAFVPISRLNKGEAGKIIDEVKEDGVRVIVKNNVPECVMITVEEYDRVLKKSSSIIKIEKICEENFQ